MNFVWDETKRIRNVSEHRLDFLDVDSYFDFDVALILATRAGRDGGARFKAIATMRERVTVLIYAPLGLEAISLVSLRPASRKERRLYEDGSKSSADLR